MWIYGKQPVYELLRSGHEVEELVLSTEMKPGEKNRYLHLAGQRNIKTGWRPKAHLQRYCGPVLHQGVIARIPSFRYQERRQFEEHIRMSASPLIVILDQIQDPHNLGAIIRTVEVTGAGPLVIPEKGSPDINATIAKTSAGAVFHVPVHRTSDIDTVIGDLHQYQIATAALIPGAPLSLFEAGLSGPLAIVIGSEGKGVRRNIASLCDQKIYIPGRGRIGSLNASVAAAVVLYEVFRRRLDEATAR